jgi:hypothetical protein
MGKSLIKWQLNPLSIPQDPKERGEFLMKMTKMVKADIESGTLSKWGVYYDGSSGYAISKLGPQEIYTMMLKWAPHVIFDAKPVLNADQVIESMKKAAETT